MINSFPYLIVISLFIIVFYLESNGVIDRRKSRFFSFFLFFFFFGLRGYVGSDWYNYSISYDYLDQAIAYQSQAEIGFQSMIRISKFFGLEYFSFLFIITLIQVVLLDNILNKLSYYISLPYIILISLFPLLIIDLLRNFTAILFVFNGIIYLLRNNNKKFFFFVLLGCLFHTSALLLLFSYFIRDRLLSKKLMIGLFSIGLVVYLFQINFYASLFQFLANSIGGRLGYLISSSLTSDEVAYGIRIGIIEKIIVFLLLIFNYDNFKRNFSPILVNLLVVFLTVNLFFSTSQSMINRFSLLFALAYCIVLSNFFYSLKFKKYYRMALFFFVIFMFSRSYVTFSADIYMYKNVLFQEENIKDRINVRAKHYAEEVEMF